MQLEGTLNQFPLGELISMIMYSSVTGVLEVGGEMPVGRIYARDGRVYHVEAGDVVGLDAFVRIYEHGDAPFCFAAGHLVEQESIWQDPLELVAQAERQSELWARVRACIPSLDCVPVLREARGDARIQVSETGWAALARIDGVRTVTQIADQMSHMPLEVAEALMSLVQQGVVDIIPPRHSVAVLEQRHGTIGERLAAATRAPRSSVEEEDEPIWRRLRARG